MRLDARTNPAVTAYAVYDAKRCCNRNDVVWVDDIKFMYGVREKDTSVTPYKSSGIMIIKKTRLIIINIIPDEETMPPQLVRMLQCENK